MIELLVLGSLCTMLGEEHCPAPPACLQLPHYSHPPTNPGEPPGVCEGAMLSADAAWQIAGEAGERSTQGPPGGRRGREVLEGA